MVTLALGSLPSITATASAASARGAAAAGEPQESLATPPQPPNSEAEEIRRLVAVGQKVSITDDQGRQLEGKIGTLSADRVTIVSRRDSTDIPYGSIVRIDRPRDGLGNGALWGFGIGAGVGLAALIDEALRDCEPAGFFSCGDPTAAAYVVIPLMTGGIGAAIGVGIDAAIRREPNIYRRGDTPRVRVIPTLGRGRTGAAVALSW
jgi:hypothetical protein